MGRTLRSEGRKKKEGRQFGTLSCEGSLGLERARGKEEGRATKKKVEQTLRAFRRRRLAAERLARNAGRCSAKSRAQKKLVNWEKLPSVASVVTTVPQPHCISKSQPLD